MNSRHLTFLKSCFRLPGFRPAAEPEARLFLKSSAFIFFFLRQAGLLAIPGIRLQPLSYLRVGDWGFTANLRINDREESLAIVIEEGDSFKDAIIKLLDALNVLISQARKPLAEGERSLLEKLAALFSYKPAPLNLHLVDTGTDLFIGCLPESLSMEVKLADIRNRDFIPQPAFPFPVFSYQPTGETPLALVVGALEAADPELLSHFTGLHITHRIEWRVGLGEAGTVKLNCRGHYQGVTEAINGITKKTGARLYMQAYPWNRELLFFISDSEEESYAAFLIYPDGHRKYLEKNMETRLRLTEAYVALNPADAEALGELTTCYGNMGEHEKVLEMLDTYLPLYPGNYLLRNNKLIALVHLQRYEEALEAGHEALKLRDYSWNTRYFLAVCHTQLGRYDESFDHLHYCVKEAPEEPFNWFQLGYTYYCIKDYDKSIESYKKSLEVSEKEGTKQGARPSIWFNMACMYSLQNRIEESKNAYIEALRLKPKYRNDLFEDKELENLRNAVDAEELYKAAGI